ncbi:SusC/RagA family TonB-linked outer membrane protein [Tenacibaculum agarivorans]|uniref:SusC/RagA family TonB-linked outer membrane protein n=1 Tax=Tenacibaculum agarivorans TaxID=1908389 RepID=UPI00094B982D|nr:SusC/RagA family TonB-linked outer membrane protein [Tenacibaculum agarivorans]
MKTKLKGILTLLIAFVVHISYAQTKTISGAVSDDTGPLPGVSIQVKGTNTGTETDFDGKYSIKAKPGDILIFSFVGMQPVSRTVGSSSTIDVTLKQDNVLEEVVVTGVASGTSRKKIGVAVNSVKAEDLQDAGAQSIDQALQGKIAGTVIQSTSGQPGQQQNIVLRAIGSLNSSQPMILIDGIEVSSSQNSVGGASNLSSRLSDIDFTNVERVETISGAAAGTIYGAQGANGVINIITKKGKAGKIKININTNLGINQAIADDRMRRSTLHRYSTNAQGLIVDTSGTPVTQLNGSAQYLAVDVNERTVGTTQLGSQGINDTPFAEQTFDATDVLFKNALSLRYGVSASGGSDKIRYLVSGNKTQQESVLVVGEYVKYDARLNLDFDVADNLQITTRFDVINSANDTGTNTDNANASNLINNVFQNLPHVDLFNRNSDGELTVAPDATDPNSVNPFFFREIQNRLDQVNRYITNFNIQYQPFEVLSLNAKYGYDSYVQNFSFFQENQASHIQAQQIPTNRRGAINNLDTQEYFQNLLLSANLALDFEKDLNISAPITSTTTFNFDWRDRFFRQTTTSGINLPEGEFGQFNVNQAATKVFGGVLEQPFRTFGFLINQKFDFGSIAGFSAGLRRDKSNRFGSGKSFTFPRFDAYVNISELLESDTVSGLKLRAAYGEAGIQPLFGQNLFTFQLTTVGSETIASLPSTVANPDLDVEIAKEFEVGTDYRFDFKNESPWLNSIDGSINYFDRKTEGAIFDLGLATSSGTSAISDNAYEISSNGIEASLNINTYKSEDFSWDFGLRFTKSKATLDKIANGLPVVVGDFFVLEEGQEIGAFNVRKVVTSLDETDSQGTPIIATADRDNFTVASSGYVVNKNTGRAVITSETQTLGSTQPDFVMTFLNDFTFNDFVSMSIQLDWFQGMDVYNRAKQWLYNNGLHEETSIPVTIEDPTGTNQTGAFVSYYTSLYNTNVPTSHFIEDGSFLRLRDISFKFKLNNLIKLKEVEQITLTLSGRNLITITDYTGLDPEAARGFGNTFQRGFDEFTHPNVKSYNVGLNITF